MDSGVPNLTRVVQTGHQLQSFKYTYLAGLVILYFDYFLTFNEERSYFWKRKKGYVAFLFMLNRYYAMLAYIVTTTMIFLPTIMHPVCTMLGDFLPFGTGIPTLLMSGLLVAARVIAVYGGSKKLAAFLIIYLVAQSGATLWAFLIPGAGPLPLPDIKLDAFEACIQLTSPRLGNSSVVWIAMDCGFDTIIISLTMFRSFQLYNSFGSLGYILQKDDKRKPTLARTLVQDGFLYFLVLITINVTWMVMVIAASPGLKWIVALPSQCIIVTMVSRITLNLRAQVYGSEHNFSDTEPALTFSSPSEIQFRREASAREIAARGVDVESLREIESALELEEMRNPRRWDRWEKDRVGESSTTRTGPITGDALSGTQKYEWSTSGKNWSREDVGLETPQRLRPTVRWSADVEGLAI